MALGSKQLTLNKMTLTKRKKMFLVFISGYLVISTIVYFAIGGFYLSRSVKKDQTFGKRINNEFVSNYKNKVYKGAYAGIVNYKGHDHYLLQFGEILIGEGRFVNIYYALKDEIMPSVIESDKKNGGADAFLILNPYGYYSGNNESYDKIFGMDTLANPAEFLTLINENVEQVHSPLFATALTIMDESIQVQLMQWTNETDSTWNAKKYPDLMYAWTDKGACKINQVQRNNSSDGLIKFVAGIADIITAPIQAIIIGLYLLLVIIAGGPVK